MTATSVTAAINAAMAVAADVAEGRLHPAQLDAAAVDECRSLFGAVVRPDDALWPLQLDITRQVLGAGGIPAGELAEWLAVMRSREPVTPAAHDGGMSDPSAQVTVIPPGQPLPPGTVVDVGTGTTSDQPMHTLSSDCPCGPTVVSVPAGHRERQHGQMPYAAGGDLRSQLTDEQVGVMARLMEPPPGLDGIEFDRGP